MYEHLAIDENDVEIYMPEYNLQGDGLPFYITSKNQINKVVIRYTYGLSPKALYNADPTKVLLGDHSIEITGFNVDGYLGGAFEASLDRSSSNKLEIVTFEANFLDGSMNVTKEIDLFRPSLEVEAVPQKIMTRFKKIGGKISDECTLSDKIVLLNLGRGTAVLSVEIEDNSVLELTMPEDLLELVTNLIEDLENAVEELKTRYPTYNDEISDFIDIIKFPVPTKQQSEKYKLSQQRIEAIFQSDSGFREDFVSTYIGAFLKNASITKDLRSFLSFLLSIRPQKIIVVNPQLSVRIPEGVSSIKFRLRYSDLLRNYYDDVEVKEIQIESAKEVVVPLSDFIQFGEGERK